MSELETAIESAQPRSLLWRDIDFNLGEVLEHVITLAFAGLWGDASGASQGILGVLENFRLKGLKPEELAHVLLKTTLVKTYISLINLPRMSIQRLKKEELEVKLKEICSKINILPIKLNQNFLDNPHNIKGFDGYQNKFAECLISLGEEGAVAQSIAARFRAYFVYNLHLEFRDNESYYRSLLEAIKQESESPFIKGVRYEQGWINYVNQIGYEISQPIFDECFSVDQIYIPLNVYYTRRKEDGLSKNLVSNTEKETEERFVLPLEKAINDWVSAFDYEHDQFRILDGEPGGGKSTATKMIFWNYLRKGRRVLYIPLHQLRIRDSFSEAIDKYLQDNLKDIGDVFQKEQEKGLVLFLDGLDELSKQGQYGAQLARDFIDEIKHEFHNKKILVLVSGRPVAVDTVRGLFKKEGVQLHLIPYHIDKDSEEHSNKCKFEDPDDLLTKDLRNDWWTQYGSLKGKPDYLNQFPEKFRNKELYELTRRPLLNFLVALAFETGKVNLDEATSNEIYHIMLAEIYNRRYSSARSESKFEIKNRVTSENAQKLWEEMALVAWHNNERQVRYEDIIGRIRKNQLNELETILLSFQDDSELPIERIKKDSVSNIFVSFYFKTVPHADSTFEFTHKSFSEFLIALRVIRAFVNIHEERLDKQKKSSSINWDVALQEWLKICGPAPLTNEILNFIRGEITYQTKIHKVDAGAMRETTVLMMNYIFEHEMPCEKILLPYKEQIHYSNNAELTLWAIHSSCALISNVTSVLKWPSRYSPKTRFDRLFGHSIASCPGLLPSLINHIDFTSKSLYMLYLNSANLHGCLFEETDLRGTNLCNANMSNTNLKNASLAHALCRSTDFQDAVLEGTDLLWANLGRANLEKANLGRANLTEANLEKANLRGANLREANLRGANLEKANLRGANLEKANLRGANLEKANLRGANLEKANFRGANLKEAHLRGANLRGANVEGANFEGAKFEGAKLLKL